MILYESNELKHYGVLGMKWGVRRARNKLAQNEKYERKAAAYDVKAKKKATQAEKQHYAKDLDKLTKLGVKAAKRELKSAKFLKKAQKADNDFERSLYEKRSAKNAYKASKLRIDADQLTKTKGYGLKSMKTLTKSNKLRKKADKVRYKMANNTYYVEKMKRKVSAIPKEERDKGYDFVKELLNN